MGIFHSLLNCRFFPSPSRPLNAGDISHPYPLTPKIHPVSSISSIPINTNLIEPKQNIITSPRKYNHSTLPISPNRRYSILPPVPPQHVNSVHNRQRSSEDPSHVHMDEKRYIPRPRQTSGNPHIHRHNVNRGEGTNERKRYSTIPKRTSLHQSHTHWTSPDLIRTYDHQQHSIGGSGSAERSEPSATSTLVQDDPTHSQNCFDFDDSKRGVHVAYGAHEDDRGCERIKVRERQRVNAAGVVGAPRGSSEDYISPRMSIRTMNSVGKGGSPGRRLRKVRMVEGDWDWLRDGDWGDPSPLDQAVR